MRKLLGFVVMFAGLIFAGWMVLVASGERPAVMSADAVLLPVLNVDTADYAHAVGAYDWQFPADYGAHPGFQTEWWYYTGNLATAEGRRFGYQFTVFRRAITPAAAESGSEWRTNQVYMAHFTITDVAADAFYQFQRFSRGGAELAGATAAPRYRVWLDNWQVYALNDDATRTRLTVESGDCTLSLELEQVKPPALQGKQGLSLKSRESGGTTYYYSLSRLLTEGTLTIGDLTFAISGTSWMDHEFGTSALGSKAQGWDWFGLHLDDKRDLMLGRIRLVDGGFEPVFGGLVIQEDGSTYALSAEDFTITVTDTWTSPHTGAVYPAEWDILADVGETQPLHLTVTPLIADQELIEGAVVYWEGAVRITGDVAGYGYVELTGYKGVMTGRF